MVSSDTKGNSNVIATNLEPEIDGINFGGSHRLKEIFSTVQKKETPRQIKKEKTKTGHELTKRTRKSALEAKVDKTESTGTKSGNGCINMCDSTNGSTLTAESGNEDEHQPKSMEQNDSDKRKKEPIKRQRKSKADSGVITKHNDNAKIKRGRPTKSNANINKTEPHTSPPLLLNYGVTGKCDTSHKKAKPIKNEQPLLVNRDVIGKHETSTYNYCFQTKNGFLILNHFLPSHSRCSKKIRRWYWRIQCSRYECVRTKIQC